MSQIYTHPPVPSGHPRPSSILGAPPPPPPRPSDGPPSSLRAWSWRGPDGRPDGTGWSSSQPASPASAAMPRRVSQATLSPADDLSPARHELAPPPAREQLPPLSSLFAAASSYAAPSPAGTVVSPRDARPAPTSLHGDRPYEAAYVPPPTGGRHGSYGARPAGGERLGIPPPPRPPRLGAGPTSPHYDARYAPRVEALSHAWSPHPPCHGSDYFSVESAPSWRPRSDFRPPAPPSRPSLDARGHDAEGPAMGPATSTYAAAPGSSGASTAKDGLGPKIWTGTQFLPRFVRQAEVPGEGMCYFYDDGTHCKTTIDGELVNAHWGVTKAGKPRKRLAIACITCREKKIKCDPDYPRCVQCEKFGRVCKFKNAPRGGGHGSPDTPPSDPEDAPSPASRADPDAARAEKREPSPSVSPRPARRASPDSDVPPPKRARVGYGEFTPVPSEPSPRPSVQEPSSPATPWAESVSPVGLDQASLRREWLANPTLTHPTLVTELLAVFFRHVPETAHGIFPEGPFRRWFLSSAEKPAEDLMLVYTVLALGTIFSQRPEHKPFGARFAAIARFACAHSRFSIQLVQARLLLSLYHFANNHAEVSWDVCGAALRTASGLKLNLEIEKTDDHDRASFPYGLTRAGYAECRRRTFWSCYLLDRFNGFCSGHLSMIQPEDVFLRLPADDRSFASQLEVENPFFDVAASSPPNLNWTVGPMAYLINVATIWGDVMANIYRAAQRTHVAASAAPFASFYERATSRLRAWKDSLPACYSFSTDNITRAAHAGKLGSFLTMHSVYHATGMKLNRYLPPRTLTTAQLAHHVTIAQQHAEDLLAVMDTLALCRASPLRPPDIHGDVQSLFSSPFVGYSIVSAIDILSAKAALAAIPARLRSFQAAQSLLTELAHFWQSSKNQQALVEQRVRDLADLVRAAEDGGLAGLPPDHVAAVVRDTPEGGSFEMREAIEKTFPRDCDCIYA